MPTWILAFLVFHAALNSPSQAQVSPNGGEVQFNLSGTGYQQRARVDASSAGEFVVVSSSGSSLGSDTNTSVQATRFSTAGATLQSEFQVNSYTTGAQDRPSVAVDGVGGFVVVWASEGSAGSDDSGFSIQARRFGANGAPLGPEFQVNTYSTGDQYDPVVDSAPDGRFAVAWASFGSGGTDTSLSSVHLRRYAASGAPESAEIQVNSYTTSAQAAPTIAMSASGSVLVAWHSNGSIESDSSGFSIQAQRFDSDGIPIGSQFQVNSITPGRQASPSLAQFGAGGFIVAWESASSTGSDSSYTSIQSRQLDTSGTPLGSDSQVNTVTTNPQVFPEVAAGPGDDFVVTWHSEASSGSDNSLTSIQVRHFDASGMPGAPDFQVNSYTDGYQFFPDARFDSDGNFVVVWHGFGSFGPDTDATSVHGQRFDALFRDGFEAGTTVRWSDSVPVSYFVSDSRSSRSTGRSGSGGT